MAFVTLNGTTVAVKSNAAGQKYNEHRVDRFRAFNGEMRQTLGSRWREWNLTAKFQTDSDANTLIAILTSNTLPLAMSGDLCGDPCAVIPILVSNDPTHTADGFRRRVVFTLHETPSQLPADTSAVPVAAFLRGRGYRAGDWGLDGWQPESGTIAAGAGDFVSAWLDQSGNGNHILGGMDYNFLAYHDSLAPILDGNELRFGDDGNARRLNLVPDNGGWWSELSSIHVIAGVRALDATPSSDIGNTLWTMGAATLFPKSSDGHLYDGCNTSQRDIGAVPGDIDLESLNAYSVARDLAIASPHYVVRFNNGPPVYSNTEGIDPDPGDFAIGENAAGYFKGWVRDLLIFDAPLNSSQAHSWNDYVTGATDDPPLA